MEQKYSDEKAVKTEAELMKEKFSIEEIKDHIKNFDNRALKKRDKIRVLYLDDELRALNSFKAAFRRNFEVYIASSGEEGRKILAENTVDVIISDQRMPEETGVEFLESIVKNYPDPIRILLTGYSDIDAVINSINKGHIYYYLTKPYRHEEVKKAIENAAEVFDLRKEKEELMQIAVRANKQLEFVLRQQLNDW